MILVDPAAFYRICLQFAALLDTLADTKIEAFLVYTAVPALLVAVYFFEPDEPPLSTRFETLFDLENLLLADYAL